MTVPAVLAIDQGTTGTTCLVIDADGRVLGRGYSEFKQHFPRNGWVEHDANEIWEVTLRVARHAVAEASGAKVCSIGIANQRETVVLWDRETIEPVHRAIVWQDRRTAPMCRSLKEAGHEEEVGRRTGLVLDPYFSGTKISWLLESDPEIRRKAEEGLLAAGTVDSWLIAKLTSGGSHLTDPTNASRTLLFNLHDSSWDHWALDLLGVPAGLLPEVRASSGEFGMSVADHLGIEVPIQGVAGDQQAALFGQGCWTAGFAKNTYGTGAFLLLHTGDTPVRSKHGLLTTAACDASGGLAYALEGSVFIAGAAIQWLRDELGVITNAGESEQIAMGLQDNGGVYLVPGFVGLGAPHWEPDARGTLFGLTRGTSSSHIVRAALEAMAYGTTEVLRGMEVDAKLDVEELRVDGGASLNEWLMQFQADVASVPVRRAPIVETTALGAAGLAGLKAGVWSTAEDFVQAQGEASHFEPGHHAPDRQDAMVGWDRAVRATLAWARDRG